MSEVPSSWHGNAMLDVAARSEKGVRRACNQDAVLVADLTTRRRVDALAPTRFRVGARGVVLGVFDGLGGPGVGDVASALAAAEIHAALEDADAPASEKELLAGMVRAIQAAGLRIWREAGIQPELGEMATTATIAIVIAGRAHVGHVGDTRAYVSSGERIVRLTRDHSAAADAIAAGLASDAVAARVAHLLQRALGADDAVAVDVTHVDLRRDDVLLLCSDGLTRQVAEEDIQSVLRRARNARVACDSLLRLANVAGAVDDVTVVVARQGGALPASDVLDVRSPAFPGHR